MSVSDIILNTFILILKNQAVNVNKIHFTAIGVSFLN